jgi:hypothetical protein
MEAEGSLPCSQKPATGPYPEQDYLIYITLSYFSKIHFNITVPLTSRSS